MDTYPPERHLLRDLRLSFEHRLDGTGRASLPVVPEICTDDGAVRAGVLATLVDCIGGGLAAVAAQPGWIATADLTFHLTGAATDGNVTVDARVLRAGRTTVVIEGVLASDAGGDIGLATMSFSVLPRRENNPDMDERNVRRGSGWSTMALPGSGLDAPFLEYLGVEVVDAVTGALALPVYETARNSMGALQGGAVATVCEAAASVALRAATDEPLVATDLQITYLGFARAGPLRTRVDVLGTGAGHGRARVSLFDDGAEGRLTTLASVVATRSLRATAGDPR